MEAQAQIEKYWRISEVAKRLNVSRATVYNLLRGFPVVRFGKGKRGVLVPESVLRQMLDRRTKTFR